MNRRGSYLPRGEAGTIARNSLISDVLVKLGHTYSGDVVFPPSETDMAKFLGRTRGFLTHGDSYSEKLETATGLRVIHRGLVLARTDTTTIEVNQLAPIESSGQDLERVAGITQSLSKEEKAQLIGRLAAELAS